MRFVIFLLLTALPAKAWEFSTEGTVCLLTHDGSDAAVRVSYVPGLARYGITITRRSGAWIDAPVFALRFSGVRDLTISTDRHSYSDAGRALTVTDRGFGNVLNGLEFNDTATAILGADEINVSLAGAAPEVRKFRDCTMAPAV
ncbi:MAG: hypothetical protein AAGF74_17095 [Pseudomonadota bacterium]